MTRKEYLSQITSSQNGQGVETLREIHQCYYVNLATLAGIHVPDYVMGWVRDSKDYFFNDTPLDVWEAWAQYFRVPISVANRDLNGRYHFSLNDGVCALKALARHNLREDQNA